MLINKRKNLCGLEGMAGGRKKTCRFFEISNILETSRKLKQYQIIEEIKSFALKETRELQEFHKLNKRQM